MCMSNISIGTLDVATHSANSTCRKMDALKDIEYVQASQTHQCIKKLTILPDHGETFFVKEFKPCMPWQFLEPKYKKSLNTAEGKNTIRITTRRVLPRAVWMQSTQSETFWNVTVSVGCSIKVGHGEKALRVAINTVLKY